MSYYDIIKGMVGGTSYGDDYDEYEIDDYVSEDGVSYEEALEAIKAKGGDYNDLT